MNETGEREGGSWRLACSGLHVRRGGRLVVHDVSLSIGGGESVSVIGPNGSGKTTLLLAVLGVLSPADGRVRLDGRDLHEWGARERGRIMAYVPQIVDAAPAMSVRDVVAGGRFPYVGAVGRLSEADRAVVGRALEQCGLAALAGRPFNKLSGGERQKALIAAAMAQEPKLLVLDEPNASLDPGYQLELVRILRGWHAAGGALLLVSHDLQLPAAIGGRVIALRAGSVVAAGPVEEVLRPDMLCKLYEAPFGTATTPDGRQIVLPEWWHGG